MSEVMGHKGSVSFIGLGASGLPGPEPLTNVILSYLVPEFAGSNPAEAVGFFRAKKSSACLPSEGK
jgi:hypothetical protein